MLQKNNFEKDEDYLSEELVKATMAVRFVVLLLECTLVQLFQTKRAHEVLRMEFTKHRRYATTCKKQDAKKNIRASYLKILNLKKKPHLAYSPVMGL